MTQFYTAESVTVGHPDKLCDLIADSVLDACLQTDRNARVACEVMATDGQIFVAGEISCDPMPQIEPIVRQVLQDVGYDPDAYQIICCVHEQSEDIAAGVDFPLEVRCGILKDGSGALGAGDQGVMVGYACDETAEMLPLPVVIAHRITHGLTEARVAGKIKGLMPDGKAQVTVEYNENGNPVRLDTVIVSAQHTADTPYNRFCQDILEQVIQPALHPLRLDEDTRVLINPTGRFVLGGPRADTGLTGRKLVADTYGTFAPHGGGAFSGKDPSKVDRSGAYAARWVAKTIVAAGLAKRCQVTLAYAIGKAEPVMVQVDTFGTGTICADDCIAQAVQLAFDLTPQGIVNSLGLRYVCYRRTCTQGHFHPSFPWERTPRARKLLDEVI